MSVYIVALFNCKFRLEEFESVRQNLNDEKGIIYKKMTKLFFEYFPMRYDNRCIWEWELLDGNNMIEEYNLNDKQIVLVGNWATFEIGEKYCLLFTSLRTEYFYNEDIEEDVLKAFREVTYLLSQFFGCSYSIYVPDGYFKPAAGVEAMGEYFMDLDGARRWLLDNCGEPALDPKADKETLLKQYNESPPERWYFIDDFSDFNQNC